LESLILDNLFFIDTISKIENSTYESFEERSFSQIKFEKKEYTAINLPLSNYPNYNNEYFTEDYMNRIFFNEFDLENSNIPKENLKNLIEINNQFAEKEIFFILNVIRNKIKFFF
jgi:hypothetical protein